MSNQDNGNGENFFKTSFGRRLSDFINQILLWIVTVILGGAAATLYLHDTKLTMTGNSLTSIDDRLDKLELNIGPISDRGLVTQTDMANLAKQMLMLTNQISELTKQMERLNTRIDRLESDRDNRYRRNIYKNSVIFMEYHDMTWLEYI